MKLVTSSISVLLLSLVASAAPIQISTAGTFATAPRTVWASHVTFTATPFTIPMIAGLFDVDLGTFRQVGNGSWLRSNAVSPDFMSSSTIVGDVDEFTSSPILFNFDITGSNYGWSAYAYSVSAKNAKAVTSVTYTTDDGTGSFDIRLRDTRPNYPGHPNWGQYPGFIGLTPGVAGTLGATIFNATFTPTPIPVTPTPEPATYFTLGMALLGLSLVHRRRTIR